MMVVDLMHEFELGVWKTLFTHLIQILHAASDHPGILADILNTRYNQLNTTKGSLLTLWIQIPSGPNFRSVYNPALSQQCLGDEKACRA